MKNRGVEIFMYPLEEININDIHSMLELQGIYNKTVRQTLIEIHKVMKHLITGITIGINHLLRTAYLVSQNITQGQSLIQVIREVCFDVYVRCLNGNSKQNAIIEIDRLLEEQPKISNDFWFLNIKTMDILQSAELSYIKQQCDVLEQHKNLNNTNLEDLLLCYFGRSSSSDIVTRSRWLLMRMNFDSEAIKHFIEKCPNLEFDMLQFRTKTVDHIDPKYLPYDFRYLPAVYFNKGRPFKETTPYAENKIHLMLDHALNQLLDKNFSSTKLQKKS